MYSVDPPVILEVQNTLSTIKGVLPKICSDQIRFATSYAVPGAHFSRAFKSGYWNGRRDLFNVKLQTFPTGLLSKVRTILGQNGLTYRVSDLRTKPNSSLNLLFTPPFPLRPYQQEVVALAPKKQRGIIRLATGGGKSLLAAGVIAQLRVPTLILVHKKDLLWQLVDTFEKSLGVDIGKIGAGIVDPKDITVAMVQTTSRLFDPKIKVDKEDLDTEIDDPEELKKFIRKTQCVIADECHHIQEGQFSTVMDECKDAFYRFGLSATPFRTDQADICIEAQTASKFVDISASYLIDQGYLATPTIYLVPFKHKKQPADIKYAALYTAEIEQNCARNTLIVDLVRKAVKAEKTVLVAVTRVEHGHLLEKLLKEVEPTTIFAHGKIDSKVRRDILKELDQKKRKVVISTTVFGEGVNVDSLDCILNAKAADSAVDSLQLAGRALRITPTKKIATVIDIMDQGCRFFSTHALNRAETYQTEPRYNIRNVQSVGEVSF